MRDEPIFKERRRNALKWIVGLVVVIWGISYFQAEQPDSTKKSVSSSLNIDDIDKKIESTQSISLNISVELRNNKKIGDRAEVWIKGMGSWYLNNQYEASDQINKFGLVSRKTPKLNTNKEIDLFFYPYGRDGQEIKTEFKLSPDFCPQGCTRDALSISVFEDRVNFFGKPIEEVHGKIEINKDL